MIRHLYVHIPFCPKLCPYCSFYSEISSSHKKQQFLNAMLAELDLRQREFELRPETIFFGGGTPSALSVSQLEYLLSEMRARLNLSELKEWTLEMNPATVSLGKAEALRELGVNRISMGVQSWEPALLDVLGRVHSAEQAERSYEILREAGFENVNLDLMFAVPGQTRKQWEQTLAKTISLQPDHIAAYCLTYEEDTEFFTRFKEGEFPQDDERDAELFELTMDMLEGAGFQQYEISNFARDGRECRHNLAYWLGEDYLGLGPSAFSTVANCRSQNVPDTENYCHKIEANESAITSKEILDEATKLAEKFVFALRTSRGAPLNKTSLPNPQLDEFYELGLVTSSDNRLVLTHKGRLFADTIAEAFV
jgi:oxygen-independent coproporphyrinogen-3 oxidase